MKLDRSRRDRTGLGQLCLHTDSTTPLLPTQSAIKDSCGWMLPKKVPLAVEGDLGEMYVIFSISVGVNGTKERWIDKSTILPFARSLQREILNPESQLSSLYWLHWAQISPLCLHLRVCNSWMSWNDSGVSWGKAILISSKET